MHIKSPSINFTSHNNIPLKDILKGDRAFYKQADYLQKTQNDFASKSCLPASFEFRTETRTLRTLKKVFSVIIFPIGIYKLIQVIAGKLIVQSSSPAMLDRSADLHNQIRNQINLESEFKYKRFTMDVDGYQIDATLVGRASTFDNGRWTLSTLGNADLCENSLAGPEFRKMLSELNSNGIIFNYPDVGSSTGLPNRKSIAKAYTAMLNLIEDKNKGAAAKEVIGWGHSLGGAVQGDSIRSHKFKDDIKYVFVKRQTFDELSRTITDLISKSSKAAGTALSFLTRILRWNQNTQKYSKELKKPEIILQTAEVSDYEILIDSSKIMSDGVISADVSLAKSLLDDTSCDKANKVFIGIPEGHNDPIVNMPFIAKHIEKMLKA
ncbi:MAG: hypothetical protein JHC93_04310 [Parachlamydiales bacterium]|nr:hypothetical protein [Parachlamydiales bacterium]